MARDVVDLTPIESRDELVAWFAEGAKPKAQWRAGTEHEKFAFTTDTREPVPYEGRRSIRSLLVGMQHLLGWEPIMDGPNIIGLADVTGGGAISLEPGGQFELSGAPLQTIHQAASELTAHLAQLREIARPLGIGFLGLGMSPKWTRERNAAHAEEPLQDHDRLHAEGRPLRSRHDVPHLHGADEPRLLLRSRHGEEAARLARAAADRDRAVCELAVHRRRPNGFLSFRSEVWSDTDNQRAGMLPFAFEDGMGFERYVDYALDVPMYFVKREDEYIDTSGLSFRDLLAGKLPGHGNLRATQSDWANHVSTIFPEVRLKRYLEMRGADSGPWARLTALPAFWVGLLYDDASLDAAWDLVKGWSAEERQKLRDDVPTQALNATIRGRTVRELAGECLALSEAGLKRRGFLDSDRRDETRYLEPLQEIVARGTTPAEVLLEKYHGAWGNSVDPVFAEYAY